MLTHLKNESNRTITENGAVTNASSGSYCLDLFASIGAMRHTSEEDICDRFIKAYAENPDVAMKILFFARDIRGGLGERRTFRTILKKLPSISRKSVLKNIPHIAEYGRYDDIISLIGTSCQKEALVYLKAKLEEDLKALNEGKPVSLLAKWLPSVNASSNDAKKNAKLVARACGMRDAEYRKALSSLRAQINIIENNLREKNYTFDYEKQPSRALFKYRAAFCRNDEDRYSEFISRVSKGESKLNTSALMPYDLLSPLLNKRCRRLREVTEEEEATLNATWKSLTEYTCEGDALAVIDTSGSMYSYSNPVPAAVALSLGLYFAEHNKGRFANHFIEFSEKPELIEIKGETFTDKIRFLTTFNRIANTDLEAVFTLILDTAVKYDLPQEDMPKRIIIISDMEFDCCVYNSEKTVFESVKKRFEENGYRLPDLVFWNVDSRHENVPVKKNDRGVMLVSGCTPRLFDMIMEDTADPYDLMLEVIGSERYELIAA